jgi:hypothetical protein
VVSWTEESLLLLEVGSGAEQIVERHHAASQQINHARFESFGAVVLQVLLDSPDMGLEVVHMAFKGLVRMPVFS